LFEEFAMHHVSKTAMRFLLCLSLLLVPAACFAQGGGAVDQSAQKIRLKLLTDFAFETDNLMIGRASRMALDGEWVYITSPDGYVLRASGLGQKTQWQVIFKPKARFINGIYVFDHVLYVLTEPETDGDHTLFRSTDRGNTFEAIDQGLLDCNQYGCSYLYSTQLFATGQLIFVNAGGGKNLLVTDNGGQTYHVLSGSLEAQACYHSPFDIRNRSVLMGGECGLDQAFLDRGQLSKDKLDLDEPLAPADTPYLGNRKVNDIRRQPGTPLVLAGAEGSLLRSTDNGKSFTFAFEYPLDGHYYPYVGRILFPLTHPDFVLIGGFDKASGDFPYLAIGSKDGTVWNDLSSLFKSFQSGSVTDLKEDQEGRLLAVVVDSTKKTVSVFQIKVPAGAVPTS
jgi:photosystem II stability/assembly factor-like uncharacterized protein